MRTPKTIPAETPMDDAERVTLQAVRNVQRQDSLAHQVEEGGPHVGRRRVEVGLEPDERDGYLPRREEEQNAQRALC